jgi:sugar/nucleoside kinase (ribokinase family)
LPEDLEEILPSQIDGFVLNPLNRYDFPAETVEYLKGFGVPIFLSIQGFLRLPGVQANENYTIKLSDFDELASILLGVDVIFLDESEKNMIGTDYDVGEMVITNGSRGSRIVSDMEIKIEPVPCDDVVDTTGCGDTYMAAYITQKLLHKSSEKAGNFASMIASEKIANFGPYNCNE